MFVGSKDHGKYEGMNISLFLFIPHMKRGKASLPSLPMAFPLCLPAHRTTDCWAYRQPTPHTVTHPHSLSPIPSSPYLSSHLPTPIRVDVTLLRLGVETEKFKNNPGYISMCQVMQSRMSVGWKVRGHSPWIPNVPHSPCMYTVRHQTHTHMPPNVNKTLNPVGISVLCKSDWAPKTFHTNSDSSPFLQQNK